MSIKKEKTEIQTIEAKHIFIDIVSYTLNRSVEAQTDLIYVLNKIVKQSLKDKELTNDQYIFIPTGDGMCISIMNVNYPFDIHIQIALLILEKLYIYNENEQDEMRKFQLRIGINENTDNLIKDINGNKNISGSGINMASRIEGIGDNSQIIVGNSVYEKLIQREKYMNLFKSYKTEIKHGISLDVHQFTNKDLIYLNSKVPSKLETKEIELSLYQVYYMANCIKHNNFISQKYDLGTREAELNILMHNLTMDCMIHSVSKLGIVKQLVTGVDDKIRIRVNQGIEEYYEKLSKVEMKIKLDLSGLIKDKYIESIKQYLFLNKMLFINDDGKKKICEEYPKICEEFQIT